MRTVEARRQAVIVAQRNLRKMHRETNTGVTSDERFREAMRMELSAIWDALAELELLATQKEMP